jgi:predicted ATPase
VVARGVADAVRVAAVVLEMAKNHYFVLTGAFGSGKSTLLECLRSRGIHGIVEPARPILAEQRSIQGNGVPEKDPRLFVELMLSRMLSTYRQSEASAGPVLFDRGIPDVLGYAKLFGFDHPPAEKAAEIYRYNLLVFITPPWEQIYRTDDERTAPFSVARDFGNSIREIYERFGYTLIEVPCLSADERADFVLDRVGTG